MSLLKTSMTGAESELHIYIYMCTKKHYQKHAQDLKSTQNHGELLFDYVVRSIIYIYIFNLSSILSPASLVSHLSAGPVDACEGTSAPYLRTWLAPYPLVVSPSRAGEWSPSVLVLLFSLRLGGFVSIV